MAVWNHCRASPDRIKIIVAVRHATTAPIEVCLSHNRSPISNAPITNPPEYSMPAVTLTATYTTPRFNRRSACMSL